MFDWLRLTTVCENCLLITELAFNGSENMNEPSGCAPGAVAHSLLSHALVPNRADDGSINPFVATLVTLGNMQKKTPGGGGAAGGGDGKLGAGGGGVHSP